MNGECITFNLATNACEFEPCYFEHKCCNCGNNSHNILSCQDMDNPSPMVTIIEEKMMHRTSSR